MSWTDHVEHGLGLLSLLVFAGAGALAAFTSADSIIRQWPRIALALRGHPVPQADSDAPHASCASSLRAVEADVQPTLDRAA